MGAVTYLPYAHSKSDAPVAVWNGAHAVVEHTTGANVTCELQRPNGLWYKLLTPADLAPDDPGYNPAPAPGRYFSAALVNLTPGPPGYAWGPCPGNPDQPGRRFPDRAVLITAAAATLAALLAAGLVLRRRRPRPEPPPVG